MATFFATVCGFIVMTLCVFVAPASAQHRSDPGEPIRFRRLAEDGSVRYQTGENTGYYRLLAFVNADRPADQQLDETAFDAANQCRVIYVCERPGRPLRVDRNGSCPELNGTSRPVDYETFCPRGERSRWTVDRKVYFSPVIITTEPVVIPPPPIPEQPPEAVQSQATPTPVVVPPSGTEQPRTAPQPRPRPTTSAQAVHEDESVVRSVLFVLALLIVGAFAGVAITYVVMLNKQAEYRKAVDRLAALLRTWVPYRRGPFAPDELEAELAQASQQRMHETRWNELFSELPFCNDSFAKLARSPGNPDHEKRVVELETEVRDRRNFEDHILTMLADLVPELEEAIRDTRKMEHLDEQDGSRSRPSLPARESFCERKLRRLVAIQGLLAVALGQLAKARESLMVARGLGYISLDSARADRRPWFGLLLAQLILAREGRILRLQKDIDALNASQSVRPPPPPPAPTNGRPSIVKTLGPPKFGASEGMGADPFPPPPPKSD